MSIGIGGSGSGSVGSAVGSVGSGSAVNVGSATIPRQKRYPRFGHGSGIGLVSVCL